MIIKRKKPIGDFMKTKVYFLTIVSALLYWVNYLLISANATDGSPYGHGDMMGDWNGTDFSMFMMGMMIFWLFINLLLAYLVYKDALSNNSPNALLWAIIVFFTSIIGVLAYVLIRGQQKQYVTNPPQSTTSPNSRAQTQIHRFCSTCGTQLDSNAKFCATCGAVVN